jgi:hypothetical protein
VAGRTIIESMFQPEKSGEVAALHKAGVLDTMLSVWLLPRQANTISRRFANGSPSLPPKPATREIGPV